MAQNSGKKYFWNNVGEGRLLDGENDGLLELSWDLFGEDVYMTVDPIKVSEAQNSRDQEAKYPEAA
jgi:hypothetical protein